MGKPRAVVGARHTAPTITWVDQDLTGAAMTGRLRNVNTGTAKAVDGVIVPTVNAAQGEFTWAYGVTDVAEAGTYEAQIIATYNDGKPDKTLIFEWRVERAL